jgi:hypothetical protein
MYPPRNMLPRPVSALILRVLDLWLQQQALVQMVRKEGQSVLLPYDSAMRPLIMNYVAVKIRLDGEPRPRWAASMGVVAAQQTAWESELVEIRERLVRDAG